MAIASWPRFNRRTLRVGTRIKVIVYDRADRLGKGRCMSVYVDMIERLRFDLFNPAHHHDSKERDAPRHYYPEGLEFAAYVELAITDAVAALPRLGTVVDWMRHELLR